MAALLHVLAIFTVLLSSCLASKFVMFPMLGRSHYLVHAKLAKELVQRGHQVVIFLGDCEGYGANDPNVHMFKCPDEVANTDLSMMVGKGVMHHIKTGSKVKEAVTTYCDTELADQEITNEIKTADLVIGDAIYLCSFLIAEKFSLPHVTILMGSLSSAVVMLPLNFEELPSYVPQFVSADTDNMNFLSRTLNALRWVVNNLVSAFILYPVYQGLKDKHSISPHKTLQQTFERLDLVIAQSDFAIDYPRPLLPNTKVIGPLLPNPPQPLPDELEQFVKGSGDDGVILVSFGTIVGALDEQVLKTMVNVFSKLPQKVIWKLKTTDKSLTLNDNIKVVPWLPQNDILGHPKTRLFIGHAGYNGLLETAYHGVPMICVPFFGDQFANSVAAKHFGIAEVLYPEAITEETLVNTINTVLSNNSYRESAARVSRSIKLRPRTPIQEAADWIEYALAQGGLQYLRPRSLDLPFYQLYLLDVLFVTTLILVGVLFVMTMFLKCCIRRFFKSQPTKHKSH